MNKTRFIISTDGTHRGAKLLANLPFTKGQIVDDFAEAHTVTDPTYLTIQVSEHEHVLVKNTLGKLNHSCRPTTFVDTERRVIVAHRDITPGEELTFFYPATEWKMAEPFNCHCGFPECIGVVGGAKFLAPGRLAQFKFNPHIIALFDKVYPLDNGWLNRNLQQELASHIGVS